MMPSTTIHVVTEWLKTIPGESIMAGDQLPRDNETWGPSGYVVVQPTGGGRHNTYLPVARPAVTLRAYAIEPHTDSPLWNVATDTIMTIVRAMEDHTTTQRRLEPVENGVPRGPARVFSCYPINHERRSHQDSADYAHVILDTMFHWVPIEED